MESFVRQITMTIPEKIIQTSLLPSPESPTKPPRESMKFGEEESKSLRDLNISLLLINSTFHFHSQQEL